MKAVFADTLYWIAIARPDDHFGPRAKKARQELGRVILVTTDEVLAEFLTGLGKGGPALRRAAVKMVRAIMTDPNVRVLPQSRESFLQGLTLFEERPDREYSQTDCISMHVMKSQGIQEVLTNDHHFEQEGLVVLIK